MNIIDKLVSFEDAPEGLVIKNTQELPDDWLSAMKRKVVPTISSSGEYEKLFSIPTSVIDVWIAEGFDYSRADEHEIARKLRRDGLDAFIVGRI